MTGGQVGEGAKYRLHVLTEIKNGGVGDVLMVVCDGLTGLPGRDLDRVAADGHPDLTTPRPPRRLPWSGSSSSARPGASGTRRSCGWGGIGFTVSLLIGELAFGAGTAQDDNVKIGVLLGSLLSAVLAAVVLRIRNRV